MASTGDGLGQDRLQPYVVLGLTALAALGSVFAVVNTVPSFTDPPAYAITRAAEAIGGLFFAALYVVLGRRPRRYPGVWELAIAHRVILAVGNGVLVTGGAVGAATAVVRDVLIAVLLVAAYAYGRGYRAWFAE